MIVISPEAEAKLLKASFELHNMALEAVDLVVKDEKLMQMFNLNRLLWPAIKKSWEDRQTDLMGRFDLAWDGENDPKMLEYNADTPSILLESGPV